MAGKTQLFLMEAARDLHRHHNEHTNTAFLCFSLTLTLTLT